MIEVSSDNWTFINKETNETFVPFGCNYFDPYCGGWPPQVWKNFNKSKVKEDFAKMKDLGVNVARIFLTLQSFMPRIGEINKEALKDLHYLIDCAKRYDIYLILTGLETWEGTPDWCSDLFVDETTLQGEEIFWGSIAEEFSNETYIFAYDLKNEPIISWESNTMMSKWNDWLRNKYGSIENLSKRWLDLDPRENWGSIKVPENGLADKLNDPRLYDYQVFREELAYNWTRRLRDAIRSTDKDHMITVGLIQFLPFERPYSEYDRRPYSGFDPSKIAELLDFISIHAYPYSPIQNLIDPFISKESFNKALQYVEALVRYCYFGKPVVLEEFGWYGGGAPPGLSPEGTEIMPYRTQEEQAIWCRSVIETTLDCASGWIVWLYQDTPQARDISKYGGLVSCDGSIKEWGRIFKEISKYVQAKKLRRVPGITTIEFSKREVLTSKTKITEFWKNYYDKRKMGPVDISSRD